MNCCMHVGLTKAADLRNPAIIGTNNCVQVTLNRDEPTQKSDLKSSPRSYVNRAAAAVPRNAFRRLYSIGLGCKIREGLLPHRLEPQKNKSGARKS